MHKDIPKIIGNAQTLFIAETDGVFALIERDAIKTEIVFIAVCQYYSTEGFYLFGCDTNFNTYTDYHYEELNEALDDAKRIYNLKKIRWRQLLPIIELPQIEEIFVSVIDGVQTWLPTKVNRLGDNEFLIINNEFDCLDYSLLSEFIPGDTVSVENKEIGDDKVKTFAISLIKPSPHPDKNYFEFLYHATIGDIVIDKISLHKYKSEIKRVNQEFKDGQYFYPNIFKTIQQLGKIEKET